MATYTIIGGDKKEYGPVSEADIRQWITEGRFDGTSMARSENDTEWRQLAAFPEFSALFASRPLSPPVFNPQQRPVPEVSDAQIKNPAIALIVMGGLSVLYSFWNFISELAQPVNIQQMLSSMPQFSDPQVQKTLNDPQFQQLLHLASSTGLRVGGDVFTLVMSALVLIGGIRMLALRNYEFAFVAAIIAMIPCLTPCLCCFIGLPIGIWALVVLRKPGVKDLFS